MIMMGDKKKAVAAILGPHPEEEHEEKGPEALLLAAHEAMEAIHSRDAEGLLDALRAIFAELDSEPHAEGEHVE